MEQYFHGMVFMGQQDHTLVALNAKTGAPIWSVQTTAVGTFGASSGSLNAPPMMKAYDVPGSKDGIVLSGFTGGDSPLRGHQDAYNARTGKLIWRTWTTPDPNQLPFILTWANPAEAALGGAALWSQAAVDPQLGMVYFGTGNAYPETGRQPGKNLWTDSLMAVDWKTGALKWYFQHVHHDMWDYDAPGVPILANIRIDGKVWPVLMQGSKTGVIWVMNRKNGRPNIPGFPIKEVPVPDLFNGKGFALTNAWKTQPKAFGGVGEITEQCYTPQLAKLKFPTYPFAPDGRPMIATCPFAAPYSDAYVAWGGGTGGGGGIGWVQMSYNPKLQYLYYCAQVEGIAVATKSPTDPSFDQLSAGARAGVVGGVGGTFGAIDMATNKIAWKHDYQGNLDETCYSGALSTAGGLAFTATRGNVYVDPYYGGVVYAYDARTGQELWRYQNQGDPGVGNHAPAGQIEGAPVTFMVNGKQYLFVGMMDRGGDLQGANRRIQNVWRLFGL
jgi:glucose dehydrogenase